MNLLRRAVTVGLATTLALTACSGDDGAAGGGTTTGAATDSATGEAVEVGEAYLRAFSGADGRSLDDMIALAAPDSVAERYARHSEALDSIRVDAGEAPDRRDVAVEGDTVIVTFTPAGGSPVRTEWSGLELDDEGRLIRFTIDGESLEDRLVLDGDPVTIDGVSIAVVSAFQLVSNESPVVIVEIENRSDAPYLLEVAEYRAPDGTVEPTEPTASGLSVPAGGRNRVALIFGTAPFGGDVALIGEHDPNTTEHVVPLAP